MSTVHYLAYGSNLHPIRLQERVPSARFITMTALYERKLIFTKKGRDLSGKCSIFETGQRDDIVYGALYEMDIREKVLLDTVEGKDQGYDECLLSVTIGRTEITPFTYVAHHLHIDESLAPYEWYKQMVIEGAKFCSVPEEYLSQIEAVESLPDPDSQRNIENQRRLAIIREFNEIV